MFAQSRHHSVADIANTALKRRQFLRQTTGRPFVQQESDQALGDLAAGRIRRARRLTGARRVCLNDGHNLARINRGIVLSNSIERAPDGDRVSMGWQRENQNVAELANSPGVMPIEFENDLLGALQQCGTDAYCARKVDAPVIGDIAGLDDGEMDRAEDAVENLLGEVRQVDIQVLYLACIEGVSHHLFGLIGRTEADGVGGSQILVYAGSGLGAADDPHLKGDALFMKACGPLGESPRDSHRWPGRSKAADTQSRAVRNQFGGLFRG
jgi:hypothetical protein